tara:strand:+ start:855 stop:1226 length:372 start_codon:yes stop_codon:yes gene_type:complete
MDDRPVRIRTDASAEDFWGRVRKSAEVSPVDFHILSYADRVHRDTPFGRQQRPRLSAIVAPPQRSSRADELELHSAIREGDKENLERTVRENDALKRQIVCLQLNLERALRINHALTSNMLTK